MTALLVILAALIAVVALNLYQGQPVVVPEARMKADWYELQRLGREHPYQSRQDHGSR